MSEQQPAGAPRALPLFALVAVCVGVAALAGAAFVLSYAGIHAVALQAGISGRMARGYPLILDVLLVVILAAVLALRGAGWPSRMLAWASLLALLAAAAGADAMHAAGDRLPARPAEITAAILPWALVLIAFVLLLAMLRQARLRRQAGAGPAQPKWQPHEPPPISRQPLVPGFPAPATAGGPNDTLQLVVPRQVTPNVAADAARNPGALAVVSPDGELAMDGELAPDDPSSDETAVDPADGAFPYPADNHEGAGMMLGSLSPAPAWTGEPAGAGSSAAGSSAAGSSGASGSGASGSGASGSGAGSSGAGSSGAGGSAAGSSAADDGEAYSPEADDSGTGDAGADSSATGDHDAGDVDADDVDAGYPDMPVFHRMWSSPVPPSDDPE